MTWDLGQEQPARFLDDFAQIRLHQRGENDRPKAVLGAGFILDFFRRIERVALRFAQLLARQNADQYFFGKNHVKLPVFPE